MKAKLKKFKSGLNLITVPIPGIQTVTIMALFKVGSKHENQKIRGVSHFIEHMLFKGTKKRPNARIISEELDKIGGSYNAFTGKEYTGYYVKVAKDHLKIGFDWLSDILINSKLEKKMMDLERNVIIEEMNMYEDTPMQHIGDLYEDLVYGDQPAGWDIAGTKKSIRQMQRKDLVDFKKKKYNLSNCVICVSGKYPKNIEQQVENYFKKLKKGRSNQKKKVIENQKKSKLKIKYKKTDQTHCMVGFRSFDLFDKKNYITTLIASILGGGMSSRLFSEIREKRGLAYYINASSQVYTDSGYLSSQAGLETKKLEEAVKVILEEFAKLKTKKITAKELLKVKNYIKGQTLISMESSNSQAHYYGTQQLLKNEIESIEEKFKKLDRVTKEDMQKIAEEIFIPQNLNVAVIGPIKNKAKIAKIIENFN